MSEEDIKKFLKGKIQSSGFSLENEVIKALRKSYTVRREIPYYDKDESKGRQLDLLARKFFPDDDKFQKGILHSIAQYALVIECKNVSGNIWVFSSDQSPGFSLPEHVSMNMNKKPDPVFNVTPYEEIQNIPYISGYDEYIFDERKSNGQTNNIYSAIMTIIKATSHEKESYKKTFESLRESWYPKNQDFILHIVFFQPVIVFSGKIYIAKFNAQNEVEFESTKFVQMKKEYVSKEYDENTGEIHIVTFSALEEYLQMVDKYYRSKEDVMVKDQKIFLDCLKLVMKQFPN